MDDQVERLERLHAQDPNDTAVSVRLKAALLRAGQRDVVERRLEDAFGCAEDWNAMAEVSPGVRRCARCQRDVHFGLTYADFERLAAKGHCVALRPDRLPVVIKGLIDSPERGLTRRREDPCLVDGGVRWVPQPRPANVQAPVYGAPPPMRTVYGAPPPGEPPGRR